MTYDASLIGHFKIDVETRNGNGCTIRPACDSPEHERRGTDFGASGVGSSDSH